MMKLKHRKTNRNSRPNLQCAFCGASRQQVKILIQGLVACICDQCVKDCKSALRQVAQQEVEAARSA